MFAQLIATVENFSDRAPKQAVKPERFMIHKIPKKKLPPEQLGEKIVREMHKLKPKRRST